MLLCQTVLSVDGKVLSATGPSIRHVGTGHKNKQYSDVQHIMPIQAALFQ